MKTKTRVAIDKVSLEYNYALQGVVDDLTRAFSLQVEASDFGEKAKITASIEAIHLASLLHKASLYDADKLTVQRIPLGD